MERATLKIEIPFTDHAHCIGRQGNQIQNIMSTTNTHIHFPDGNREPNTIKSNQVSITGTISSIEQAHKHIKDILPMSLKFLIPSKYLIPNNIFENVQIRFNVLVQSRSHTKTGDIYCIIRGLINQPELIEATEYLIQIFYGFKSSLIKVTCQIEVSEQYHIYLQTRQQIKDMSIISIEQYTHTKIKFPKEFGRKTSSIIITGSPAQVCQARKLFDFCLPIILTFEIPIEKEPTRAEIMYMKDKLNITTIIRTRKEKFIKLINLQTQEYNSKQLYHAHSIIFNLSEIHQQDLSFSLIPPITLIPIESVDTPLNEMIIAKKPSPIGYERSSLLKRSINSSSTELFTVFHSMKYFENNDEIMTWPESFDMNDYGFLDDMNKNIFHEISSSPLSI